MPDKKTRPSPNFNILSRIAPTSPAGAFCVSLYMDLRIRLKPRLYDSVKAGCQHEVYRGTSSCWVGRVEAFDVLTDTITLYAERRGTMTFMVKDIYIREGRPDWGAEPAVRYFVFILGERSVPSPACAL